MKERNNTLPNCFANSLYYEEDEDCLACKWWGECTNKLGITSNKRRINILYWVSAFIICGVLFAVKYFN